MISTLSRSLKQRIAAASTYMPVEVLQGGVKIPFEQTLVQSSLPSADVLLQLLYMAERDLGSCLELEDHAVVDLQIQSPHIDRGAPADTEAVDLG